MAERKIKRGRQRKDEKETKTHMDAVRNKKEMK
jgi:hypothetical protein